MTGQKTIHRFAVLQGRCDDGCHARPKPRECHEGSILHRAIFATLLALAPIATQADHAFQGRDLDWGAQLYAGNCAACHGANLEGQPDWRSPGPDGVLPAPPHDASGHTWHHDTPLLLEYTRLGGQAAFNARGVTGFNSGMPAFGDILSNAEIMDILAYIRSTWPEQARQVQAERTHALPAE